ncbi:MAG: hypothetical protein PHS82_03325 [Lachnospiraceae bacterium]|nr:hypothetical protein [Lachnospiraceae bacterium]
MTVTELSQLYWLNREIEMDQKRLEDLEGKALPGSPAYDGMPHSHDNSSKVERLAAEIVDLQAIIAAKQIQCIHERQRLECYISTIPDSETRMIFTFRFINGLPWGQVAACIGEGNTGDRVKKVCYRYLERFEAKEEAKAEHQLYEAEKRSYDFETGVDSIGC